MFFNEERAAHRDFNPSKGTAGVFYYFSDHLKTAPVITDSAGSLKADVSHLADLRTFLAEGLATGIFREQGCFVS